MSVSSLNGALGFATQATSGSAASYRYNPTKDPTAAAGTGTSLLSASAVKWHAATDIDFGAVQDQRAAPIEVNSEMVPLGGYKGMVYVAGGATLNPRLEDSAGVLFQNLLGYSATSLGINESGLLPDTAMTSGSSSVTIASTSFTTGGAAQVAAKTLVATVISSDNIASFGLSGKMSFTGVSTSGSVVDLTPLVGKGAVFSHVAAGGTATGTPTAIVMPKFLPATTNAKVNVGWYSATAKEHRFTFNPSDKASIGWMTVRKLIPRPSGGSTFGEEGIDCRLANFRLNVPANGVVSARVDWQGRQPQFYNNPTWTPSFDSFKSVPISCVLEGGIVIPGYSTSKMPITNMSLTMSNNTTQPQQEMVIGSYFPDDFVPLSRAMTITATYKWYDAALYRAILTGSQTGLSWSPTPWYSPFYGRVVAPNATTDGIVKYSLTAFAPKVMWSVAAPPALAGGDLIMLQLQGTVMKPDVTGQEYCSISLVNDIASYAFA